jgi:hypothetical protein
VQDGPIFNKKFYTFGMLTMIDNRAGLRTGKLLFLFPLRPMFLMESIDWVVFSFDIEWYVTFYSWVSISETNNISYNFAQLL